MQVRQSQEDRILEVALERSLSLAHQVGPPNSNPHRHQHHEPTLPTHDPYRHDPSLSLAHQRVTRDSCDDDPTIAAAIAHSNDAQFDADTSIATAASELEQQVRGISTEISTHLHKSPQAHPTLSPSVAFAHFLRSTVCYHTHRSHARPPPSPSRLSLTQPSVSHGK